MPIPKSRPAQTGPKTDQGKASASKNAVTHGLSALVHEAPGELELVHNYTSQLTEHYQPDSPLESLQVSRIARTWAKLERSYEQEQAKLALALYEFESAPRNTTSTMKEGSELELFIAESILEGRAMPLPHSISEEEVEGVVREAKILEGQVTSDSDFENVMPQLFNLVNNIKLSVLNGLEADTTALDRLKIVARDLREIFSDHGPYVALMLMDIEKMERYRREESSIPGSRPQRSFARRSEVKAEPNKIHEEFVNNVKLFVKIGDAFDKAKTLVEKLREHKRLMRDSVSLSPEDSDRFARYQATLERRLSSQIGELRVMQADKLRSS
jgi:hypothetical protein